MGQGMSNEVSPIVPVVSNGSSADIRKLNDSTENLININVAGGTFVVSLIIFGLIFLFVIWKLQRIHHAHTSHQLHHLSRYVGYPSEEPEEQLDIHQPRGHGLHRHPGSAVEVV